MAIRWYLHTLSGVVDRLEERVAEHPSFAPYMVEVPPGTKSYAPELHKPVTAEEYLAARRKSEKPIEGPSEGDNEVNG